MSQTDQDSPHVIAIPPILFTGGFVAALILQWLVPFWPFPDMVWKIVGFILAILSGILSLSAFIVMRRKTNIDVRKPTLDIVSDGPYKFTRNPLYLSLVLLSLGIGMFFDFPWMIVALIVIVPIMHFGVIRREERYLEGKFGDLYLIYKAEVRRWI